MESDVEIYLECYILNHEKMDEIESIFNEEEFITTHKDDGALALLRENTYIEYYHESAESRYYFHVIHEDLEKEFFTDRYDKIDTKINYVLKLIKTKNK